MLRNLNLRPRKFLTVQMEQLFAFRFLVFMHTFAGTLQNRS